MVSMANIQDCLSWALGSNPGGGANLRGHVERSAGFDLVGSIPASRSKY